MIILPDFLNATEVAELLAANARFTGPRRGRSDRFTDCPLWTLAVPGTAELIERVANALHDGCPDLPGLCPDFVAYTVMKNGASHPLHADAVKADGSPNHTPQRVASAMLYLGNQDEDFGGGSIHFPGVGTTITPRRGMLVGFLTDWTHRHEVRPVIAGERHAVAFWYLPTPHPKPGTT